MGDKLGVHAYLVESNANPGIANSVVTLENGVTNLALTPSLTDKNDADAEYRLVIDNDVLAQYNTMKLKVQVMQPFLISW